MTRNELLSLAERLLTQPTAPYHEHAVREAVIEHCRQLGLPVEMDRVGNVIVKYVRAPFRLRFGRSRPEGRSHKQMPPLVFMAHMDHPGFEALGGKRAEFLGGVPKEWFVGAPVRFYADLECGGLPPLSSRSERQSAGKPAHSIIRTKIRRLLPGWPKRKLVELDAPVSGFGQWDVTRFAVRNGRLYATGIDDVLSVVVVLAALAEIKRRRLRTHVWGVFTRAEEVGFNGAVELARAGKIPRRALVISMEMSRQRPWARIGDGPVVRVGDRMTMFSPEATYFLQEVARRAAINAQRALMDGGTTEATAFGGFGYRVGGLCLPLGNYHNIGPNRKIRAEFVSVNDLEGLVKLTVAAAREWPGAEKMGASLRNRVEQIRAEAPRELKR
jgi:putative aminopeptidase FrvX